MTRLVFVDDDVVMLFEAALPAGELAAAVQAGQWALPPALAAICPAERRSL